MVTKIPSGQEVYHVKTKRRPEDELKMRKNTDRKNGKIVFC